MMRFRRGRESQLWEVRFRDDSRLWKRDKVSDSTASEGSKEVNTHGFIRPGLFAPTSLDFSWE